MISGHKINLKCEKCGSSVNVMDYVRESNEEVKGFESEPISLCAFHSKKRIPEQKQINKIEQPN